MALKASYAPGSTPYTIWLRPQLAGGRLVDNLQIVVFFNQGLPQRQTQSVAGLGFKPGSTALRKFRHPSGHCMSYTTF